MYNPPLKYTLNIGNSGNFNRVYVGVENNYIFYQ